MNIFYIPLLITFIYLLTGAISDLKWNIISNKLTLSLTFLGLVISGILSIIFQSLFFIISSVISLIITFLLSYFLWILGLWAGGDVKLLSAIGAILPVNYLNLISIPKNYLFIPFTFHIIINSILISFPIILIYILYYKIKKMDKSQIINKIKYEALFFNLFRSTNQLSSYLVPINALKEGMVLDNIEFKDLKYFATIENSIKKENNGNIKIIKDNNKLILKSESSRGLTEEDIRTLKDFYENKILKGNLFIKITVPFGPFICISYIVSLFFGNILLILI